MSTSRALASGTILVTGPAGQKILTTAGFQVNVQQGSGPAQYANGTVFSQQPANGTATKGATVTIFVQNGASASAPPSDTGSPSVTPSDTPTNVPDRRLPVRERS